MTLLELRNVEARYGPVKALHGVSLTVGGASEVVRVQVRDDDALDRRVELAQHGGPLRLRVMHAQTRVNQGPSASRCAEEVAVDVIDSERKRERDPPHAVQNFVHV